MGRVRAVLVFENVTQAITIVVAGGRDGREAIEVGANPSVGQAEADGIGGGTGVSLDRAARCQVFANEAGVVGWVPGHAEDGVHVLADVAGIFRDGTTLGKRCAGFGAHVLPDCHAVGGDFKEIALDAFADERVAIGQTVGPGNFGGV